MRFGLRFSYRDLPRFVFARLDRVAGEINVFLAVFALGLAMLDLLCVAQKFVDALPPSVQAAALMH